MDIGSSQAFPFAIPPGTYNEGMTYREWLIGMIAGGVDVSQKTPTTKDEIASRVVGLADAILARMGGSNGT